MAVLEPEVFGMFKPRLSSTLSQTAARNLIIIALEAVRLFTGVSSEKDNYTETKWGGGKPQGNLCSLHLKLIRVN